ncbi:MAG: hypothetical protein ACRC5C_03945 [Bacilli bacterium]
MKKNAYDHVEETVNYLEQAAESLHQALQTVEKPDNRSNIEQSLSAVQEALRQADYTQTEYVDNEQQMH